jgi:glycopeptide antibiotics resistance protein
MLPPREESRLLLGLLALGYLVFAVYGSLVPLDYTPVPWDEAVERFRNIRFLQLGIGSRADWVANLLLFIPLTFLWLGWLWPRSVPARVVLSVVLWIAAALLSLAIEFTQIHFPPRTVSQNDILAESVGALVGIGFWWWMGPALWAWVQRWREARGVTSVAEYLLWAYLGGLFIYNILPLDLTISPVEIYHKWKDGGVNLIPFAYPVDGVAELVYAIAADIVIWVPVSILWVVSGRRTPRQALLWTVGMALLLEVLQFFVYSRVSDVTDVITAAVGGGIGALIALRLPAGLQGTAEEPPTAGPVARRHAILPWLLLGVVVWIGLLCVVFWYPYDFHLERTFLRERLPLLMQVPLRNYYYGTEFRAITEVFHKLLFAAPLGALLALSRLQIPRFSVWRTLFDLVALALMLGVPALVELGQVALPDKHPDSTDWLLMVMGAGAAFVLVLIVRNKMVLSAGPRPVRRPATGVGEGVDAL